MKTMNQFLFASALAATMSLAGTVAAQSQLVGDDGIAASPKVRQMLNERRAVAKVAPAAVVKTTPAQIVETPTVASVSYRAAGNDGIAASPKVRQMLNDRKAAVGATTASELAAAGYQPTAADGITASPKVRQLLNERSNPQIIIAPLK